MAACTPALTPGGQQVRVQTFRPDCKEFPATLWGPGDGIDHAATDPSTDTSHSGMRNDAATMGANVVMIVGSDTLGSTVKGRVFACRVFATPPPNLNASPSSPPSDPDPEQRLKRLKELLDKGLITNDDYEQQRAVILQSI